MRRCVDSAQTGIFTVGQRTESNRLAGTLCNNRRYIRNQSGSGNQVNIYLLVIGKHVLNTLFLHRKILMPLQIFALQKFYMTMIHVVFQILVEELEGF